MADKYDLVIFGSTASARLLALSLTRIHKARILLIIDPEQPHRLFATPQTSAGFCTSAAFFERAAESAAAAQQLLATLDSELLVHSKPTAIFTQFPQHMPMLEFTEGAAIHAGVVCERRIHPETQTEQLVFPDSLNFEVSNIIQACDAHNLEADEYAILSRAELTKSHLTKDGRFTGRTEDRSLKAGKVLLLDPDLIAEQMSESPSRSLLLTQVHNIIRFSKLKQLPFAAQQDISTGLWQFETSATDFIFSAPAPMDQLTTHLFKHHNDVADRRVRQMDHCSELHSVDGYLVCDALGIRNTICFASAQNFDLVLMPELANHISNLLSGAQTNKDSFWQNAKIGRKRGGEGTLLRAGSAGSNE
jgi:hypothetical protein